MHEQVCWNSKLLYRLSYGTMCRPDSNRALPS